MTTFTHDFDIDHEKFIAKSRNFPEIKGNEEEVNLAIILRNKTEHTLETNQYKIRLYGEEFGNFYDWLFFNGTQAAQVEFWLKSENTSLEKLYEMYLKKDNKAEEKSKDDLEKFNKILQNLKENKSEMPELINSGRPSSCERAIENRKDAQRLFFESEAKRAYCEGLISLADVTEMYESEFLENNYTRFWESAWNIAAAIGSLRIQQENKRTGKWGK